MSVQNQQNNKRIVKNTLFLYFRMLLVMGVSLFTTRIVLKTLGVDDFGIFNVVGGIVVMFSFLSSTMASASQRFFAVELGRGDLERLNQIFSITMLIYVAISAIIVLFAESIGLWFLNTQMTIPQERIVAANWVYQFSILSFVVTVMMIPYNAAVIVQEDMKVFALVSIMEVLLKLGVVYLLLLIDFDKLKLYASLIFLITLVTQCSYYAYCKKHYTSYKFHFYWEKKPFFEMLGFAGWNMVGAVANVLRSQGINILLNIFFNPAINAARAIAYQVNTAITNFTNNFYMAVRPQIFKSYSAGNVDEMHKLVLNSARYAYLLMLVLIVPVFCETDFLLRIWLEKVPDYAVLFTRLILINALLEVFSAPLVNAIQATGKIKNFQLIVSVIYLLNVPITFVLLKNGFPPETAMYINIGLVLFSFIPRLILCEKVARLPAKDFLMNVLLKVLLVTCAIAILTMLLNYVLCLNSILALFVDGFVSLAIVLWLGIKKVERRQGMLYIKKKLGFGL